MPRITYTVHADSRIARIDPRLYGSFVEHLGRAVYTGIYEPGHPEADEQGFRQDVLELVKDIGVTTVRYPGGNFVSGFNWRDGIGPKESRPVRLDYAWISKETNQFGIDEFANWSQKAGVTPMIAVNLGTGTPQEAGYFLEYCNHPSGTALSDLRAAHGRAAPYDFKLWCLGNEMDGPWQTGQLSAEDYMKKARETAKIMRWIDPEISLVACGSSHSAMPTFPEWDRIVLEGLYEHIDYISCHQYYENEGNPKDFLASFLNMDNFIETITSTINYAKAKTRSDREVMISFDEWNVWYLKTDPWDAVFKDKAKRFQPAPPLLEDHYSFLDALVIGGLLCTLVNHADRVKMASLAQLVNVIAPIFTQPGGDVIRQTIFWPFQMVATYGQGYALRSFSRCPTFETRYGDARLVQSALVYNEERQQIVLFALNCDFSQQVTLALDLQGFGVTRPRTQVLLQHQDLNARNTFDQPDNVSPRTLSLQAEPGNHHDVVLPPLSWNMLLIDIC
ncbi:arabinosylfuranosidase ArfA [Biostraticola tofi]|uniref:non-reducing end alpha-L-arabinofuranosidase n=1 Tax=Biostraticola tofi TaxID=466109 RepID=A0A4R3YQT9_9GAMM|nr:alpha-N-arabinofuranosidase [Biostraticola tofi]TCV95177.1 alpha-N-arabinofuranosidase [Biostraticola tofi]